MKYNKNHRLVFFLHFTSLFLILSRGRSKDVADKTAQTEPLSPELVSRSQVKEATVEKLPEAAKPIEAATSESISEKDVHHASAVDSEKIVDDTVHQQYDGMPSFDEWKKMMLAEQQRGGNFYLLFYELLIFYVQIYVFF